jgi:hypothetical protein
MDELYAIDLEHYKRPHHGRPERFDLEFEDSTFCGDEQHVS